MKPCKYCGFTADRNSDDDCPARWRNRIRAWIERALDWLYP